MRALPTRLAWALACLAVWPLYYAALILRSLLPTWLLAALRRRSTAQVFEGDMRLFERFRNPPYLDRLRG